MTVRSKPHLCHRRRHWRLGHLSCQRLIMKDVDSIPDDIWISIFENVSEPWQLAQLVKTCRRFRVLAIKPLLRDLEWTKDSSALSNVSSWNTMYSDLTSLPKMLTVELSYNLKQNSSAFDMRVSFVKWPLITNPRISRPSIFKLTRKFTAKYPPLPC